MSYGLLPLGSGSGSGGSSSAPRRRPLVVEAFARLANGEGDLPSGLPPGNAAGTRSGWWGKGHHRVLTACTEPVLTAIGYRDYVPYHAWYSPDMKTGALLRLALERGGPSSPASTVLALAPPAPDGVLAPSFDAERVPGGRFVSTYPLEGVTLAAGEELLHNYQVEGPTGAAGGKWPSLPVRSYLGEGQQVMLPSFTYPQTGPANLQPSGIVFPVVVTGIPVSATARAVVAVGDSITLAGSGVHDGNPDLLPPDGAVGHARGVRLAGLPYLMVGASALGLERIQAATGFDNTLIQRSSVEMIQWACERTTDALVALGTNLLSPEDFQARAIAFVGTLLARGLRVRWLVPPPISTTHPSSGFTTGTPEQRIAALRASNPSRQAWLDGQTPNFGGRAATLRAWLLATLPGLGAGVIDPWPAYTALNARGETVFDKLESGPGSGSMGGYTTYDGVHLTCAAYFAQQETVRLAYL